jgi:hypothetical protein
MKKILKDVRLVKKAKRNPLRFDALHVFAAWAHSNDVTMTAPDAVDRFADFLRVSLQESMKENQLLFGNRTEAMFEAVVANMGAVLLVKSEDGGNIFAAADQEVRVPDVRIVLSDGRNVLVEVKNHHRADPLAPFSMRTADLDKLRRYAELTRAEFRMAIYWTGWGMWTLVSPARFKQAGNRSVIEFGQAIAGNDMGALGDIMIGCRSPAIVQQFVLKRSDGAIALDHERSKVFTGGREVTDPFQQQIVRFMIFYSGAHFIPLKREEHDDHRVVEVGVMQLDEDGTPMPSEAGCSITSTLSGLLSRHWLRLTSDWDGYLATLHPQSGTWDDQILTASNEKEQMFALARIRSSLDDDSEDAK